MTKIEAAAINRAISILASLVNQPQAVDPIPRSSPVWTFADEYLAPDPKGDITCEEAWRFFEEVAQAEGWPVMRKAVFLRQLPGIIEETFGARKCHHVVRNGRRQRGFRGVGLRTEEPPDMFKFAP
jgi:hypothetical protein